MEGSKFCSFPKTLGILVWVSVEFSYAGCTNISMKPLVGVFKKEKKGGEVGGRLNKPQAPGVFTLSAPGILEKPVKCHPSLNYPGMGPSTGAASVEYQSFPVTPFSFPSLGGKCKPSFWVVPLPPNPSYHPRPLNYQP